VNKDSMSPRERFEAFLTGKTIDRFLCVPLILNHAARVMGVKIGDYNRNGRLMGDCHAAAWKRYRHDLIAIFSDTAILAEAMGTRLKFRADDVPTIDIPAVTDPSDRSRLTRPSMGSARLPVHLEAIRTAVAEVGDQVPVSCCFSAPFTTAACLRGPDQFARDLIKRRELAHELLRLALEVGKQFTDAVADSGGIPVIVDPVATGSVLGENQFREFALPYLKEQMAHIVRRGFPAVLHICGKTSRILQPMLETGSAVLSLDDISMDEARERVSDKAVLMGNVRPVATLLQGTPSDVENEVRDLCAIGRRCKAGFILGSGCEVPIASPPANVEAMMNAVRTYGSMN